LILCRWAKKSNGNETKESRAKPPEMPGEEEFICELNGVCVWLRRVEVVLARV
jgi:hypothetical protein